MYKDPISMYVSVDKISFLVKEFLWVLISQSKIYFYNAEDCILNYNEITFLIVLCKWNIKSVATNVNTASLDDHVIITPCVTPDDYVTTTTRASPVNFVTNTTCASFIIHVTTETCANSDDHVTTRTCDSPDDHVTTETRVNPNYPVRLKIKYKIYFYDEK